jgi:SAM-dependent MidA family methyltransferase
LPCEALALRSDGWCERGVGVNDDGSFGWRERPAAGALAAEMQRLLATLPAALEPAYETELCRRTGPWIAAITAQLSRGVALFIDYGLPRAQYYHPDRASGTLRCHYRQRAHDNPFFLPGLQDLTAWVDFTRVAEAADDCGLDVLGFTTQAAFLLGTGIEALVAAAPEGLGHARLVSQARALLLPDQMGEAFKVMALGRQWEAPLDGFAHQDLLNRL